MYHTIGVQNVYSIIALKKPHPDFRRLEQIIKRERKIQEVPFVEIVVNPEVIEFVGKTMMGTRALSMSHDISEKLKESIAGGEVVVLERKEETFYKHYINFFYRMGYDYVPEFQVSQIQRSILATTLPKRIDLPPKNWSSYYVRIRIKERGDSDGQEKLQI